VIELLAITDDATPPAPPLGTVRCGQLSVRWAPASEGAVDAETLWQREELLERLMEQRDLLPVRFGTVVADEHAAAEAIRPRAASLAEALERVRGAVELSVRAVAPEPEQAAAPTGREYLRDRLARERLARELHAPLAAAARDSTIYEGPEALRAAYLVDRGGVDAFVARFRELQQEHSGVAMVCTGPWPPYSFTGGAG
jgi:hypothetical protein